MVKLMKYELRSSLRLFIPLWIGALVVSILHALTSSLGEHLASEVLGEVIMAVMTVAVVLVVLAIMMLPLIYLIIRFYHSTVKDEAYLTFTLPVSVDSILWSKVLSGMLLYCASMLVALLMAAILLWEPLSQLELKMVLQELFSMVDSKHVMMIGLTLLLMVPIGAMSSMFQIFLSMAIGQTSDKHKAILSVAAYFGINMVIGTLTNMVTLPLSFGVLDNPELIVRLADPNGLLQMVWMIYLILCGVYLLLTAAFYIPTRILFKKRLNLA